MPSARPNIRPNILVLEMPPNRPGTVAESSARSRSAATNSPASRWNKNTATGRRCRDLFWSFMSRLGTPTDPAAQASILAAAEQVVISELARSECLSGLNGMNMQLMIRAENLAARTLKRLGLEKPVSSKRAGPSLQDIKARYAPAPTATDEAGA